MVKEATKNQGERDRDKTEDIYNASIWTCNRQSWWTRKKSKNLKYGFITYWNHWSRFCENGHFGTFYETVKVNLNEIVYRLKELQNPLMLKILKSILMGYEVIEAVIDTNYRRLIDGWSIDISLGGIHNIVVGSAWGWVDKTVTNLSNMIMLRQDSRDKWERYWKQKLGINDYFNKFLFGMFPPAILISHDNKIL